MRNIFLLITVTLLVTGCIRQPQYWTMTDEMNRVMKTNSFEVRIPEQWVRTTVPRTWEIVEVDGERQSVMLESISTTRDGTGIHAISVTRRYLDSAFPTIKKKINARMLLPEVSDLYVSELRKRSGLERLKVLSNKPAKVNGKPAFKLVMQFKNDDGLRIRLESYGFIDKTGFYTISYRAPYLYYYNRDHKEFNRVVRSFRQLKGAHEPPPEQPFWVKLFT